VYRLFFYKENLMNIKQIVIRATKILKENSIENSSNIARILLANILNEPKEYLVINDKEEVGVEILEKYNKQIQQIIDGYPLQYITNHQEFMKLDFFVDENVLIPQPDTEILVEEALKSYEKEYNGKEIKILDLCTGSGAIAISLKKYIAMSEVTAIDISHKALEVARHNAEENKVSVRFIESDLFEKIDEKYDMIVSNPPYIEREILKDLPKEVQKEPKIALDGGIDGLQFYREISNKAYKHLRQNGFLIIEIGYNQKESVTKILEKEDKYRNIECIKDLGKNDRVIKAQLI